MIIYLFSPFLTGTQGLHRALSQYNQQDGASSKTMQWDLYRRSLEPATDLETELKLSINIYMMR